MTELFARIRAVQSYFPDGNLTNSDLSGEFPEWSVEKIADKTGIHSRHISGPDEFSSDLATNVCRKLFTSEEIDPAEIQYLIVCTQSPDFFLPSTSAIVHHNIGLSLTAGAVDINLGCSGYVYALGLAKGLIETGQVENVLVVTADTWSKFINPLDKSVRTIFGDGATATYVTNDAGEECLRGFVYGTDGSGAGGLIVPRGGLRSGESFAPKSSAEARGLVPSDYDLYMDGPGIFNFTLKVVPGLIEAVTAKTGVAVSSIDQYVFHQANRFMLDHLRKKLDIAEEKFPIYIENCGNTISSTIPILIEHLARTGAIRAGSRNLLAGFGVGLSWAGALIDWTEPPAV